ncbi:DNA/RNA non-specific endonuclease [Thermaurantiacus sp.]
MDTNFLGRMEQAEAEARKLGIETLAAKALDLSVEELAPSKAVADRKRFLLAQLGDEESAELAFERVLAGNEIQPINYLERGARAAAPIARVTMCDPLGRNRGFGSSFLILPGVLITNNHVLPAADWAARSFIEFDYALDCAGDPLAPYMFRLRPDRLFATSKPLDYTVVAVEPVNRDGVDLSRFGFLPLIAQVGKIVEGEWLTIIQHPAGDRKAVCVRENRFLKRSDDTIWYSTDTLGGSSGSPVFNNEWQVVALHHAGVPERNAEGRILTVSGEPFDPARHGEADVKWIANAGIRVSRIVATLLETHGDQPLLQPLKEAELLPDPTRIGIETRSLVPGGAGPAKPADTSTSDTQAQESFADFDAPLAENYALRTGYDPDFLGPGLSVPLPALSAALKREAARLSSSPARFELRYMGFSTVQHARRRLPIFSAANVDFANRFAMKRPKDVWRIDPRIPVDQQLGEFYYQNNRFDRGHLTRREDMEYGATRLEALQRANDTNHFTNCAPQHDRFNRSRETWLGLEQHLLEDSLVRKEYKAIVISGPVLAEDDPAWDRFPDIRYPRLFWKVAVVRTADGRPFAAAFVLDQTGAIRQFGIEEALPIEPFRTFQVPIREVERLTGLRFRLKVGRRFRALSSVDPLAGAITPRSGLVGSESARVGDGPEGWVPLWSVRAVVRPQRG